MTVPKISVVIVNYRGWETLSACLDALVSNQSLPREVIVVDNRSGDGKLGDFQRRYPSVRFIENAVNAGFARANNLGASQARGRYLLFLNPDTVLPEGALDALWKAAGHYGEETILSLRQCDLAGREEQVMRAFPSPWSVTFLTRPFYGMWWRWQHRERCPDDGVVHPEWVSGSLVWIARTLFDRLGGWDERYWLYYEDVDLCRRARKAGTGIAMLCEPVVLHRHGGTTRRDKRKVAFFKTYVLISRHIYFSLHYPGLRGILLQTLLVINNLLIEQLLPALAGLLLFPLGVARRYLFIYLYLVRYYLRAATLHRWALDPGELPYGKNG